MTKLQELHGDLQQNYPILHSSALTSYQAKKIVGLLDELGYTSDDYQNNDDDKLILEAYAAIKPHMRSSGAIYQNAQNDTEKNLDLIYGILNNKKTATKLELLSSLQTFIPQISKLTNDAEKAIENANQAKKIAEEEFSIKATYELEVEYSNAFDKYSELSKNWLIASGVFAFILLLVIACPIKWCIETKDNNKSEIINEQKNKTEQTITKDGTSNIIKQTEGVKTYENKHELADTLHDISPYATKFSIIVLLIGLSTFCVKISLSYRRLAEEYNHKTILAKNLLMGGKALEGFFGDKYKMVEAFAIPSLLQILEDPLAKSRKDKGGNEATLIEKIVNKLVELTEKKKD